MHYHFIRERILADDVDLEHINTNIQMADIFTKALGADKLWQFMTNLGLTVLDLPSLRVSTEETTHNKRSPQLRIMQAEAWTSQLHTMQAEARTSQLRTTQAEARIPQLRIILAEADFG